MTMTNIEKTLTLNTEKLKKAARKYKLEHSDLTYGQCLQKVSVLLFDKTYEEIKSTLLDKMEEDNNVTIIHIGSEQILTLNGEYVSQLSIGTEMEISEESLYSMAQSLAIANNTQVSNFHLPYGILGEEWENEEAIALVGYMGGFDVCLIGLVEDMNTTVFLNGMYSPYKLNGDWESEIVDSVESGEDYKDFCLWFAECQEGHNYYEFNISFKQLCEAKQVDENTWVIDYHGNNLTLELKR